MKKHPTQEQYIELLKEQRRNSRRAINRCNNTRKYEKHLTLINEAEEDLLRFGIITEKEMFIA